MVGMITSQTVELPENETLFQQLVSLQRTTGRGGADSVTHVRGGHDDVVNGVAGLFSLLPVETSFFLGNWGGSGYVIDGKPPDPESESRVDQRIEAEENKIRQGRRENRERKRAGSEIFDQSVMMKKRGY